MSLEFYYRKRDGSEIVFPCPVCGEIVSSKRFESCHAGSCLGLDSTTRCVWCRGAYAWPGYSKNGHAGHLLECWKTFLDDTVSSSSAARRRRRRHRYSLRARVPPKGGNGSEKKKKKKKSLGSSLAADLARLEDEFRRKDSETVRLRGLIERKGSEVVGLEGLIDAKDSEIVSLHGLIGHRDAEIKRLRERVESKNSEIVRLGGLVDRRDARIVRLLEGRRGEGESFTETSDRREGEGGGNTAGLERDERPQRPNRLALDVGKITDFVERARDYLKTNFTWFER